MRYLELTSYRLLCVSLYSPSLRSVTALQCRHSRFQKDKIRQAGYYYTCFRRQGIIGDPAGEDDRHLEGLEENNEAALKRKSTVNLKGYINVYAL